MYTVLINCGNDRPSITPKCAELIFCSSSASKFTSNAISIEMMLSDMIFLKHNFELSRPYSYTDYII